MGGLGTDALVDVIQDLSLARSREKVVDRVRRAARKLTGADGGSFVLHDERFCFYVDEDAVGPLWKGRRFPLETCGSGWATLNQETAVIPDIYEDPRVAFEAYRPTFVKSLAMLPIRKPDPLGAIGNYWATHHQATPREVKLLETLANTTFIAFENLQLIEHLRQANTSLESSLRARDEFITVVAHELRTQLAALLLQLEFGSRTESEGPRARFASTLRHGETLAELVEWMVVFSRVRMDALEIQPERIDLTARVRAVALRHLLAIESANGSLIFDVAERVEIQSDGTLLEQVLGMLLANARKHAPGTAVTVSLRAAQAGLVVLNVRDEGPGIALYNHARLFERFVRGVAPGRVSGLGLYLGRHIVEAHGVGSGARRGGSVRNSPSRNWPLSVCRVSDEMA